MRSDIKQDVQIAMFRYTQQGYTIRKYTPQEIEERLKAQEKQPPIKQLPFNERLKQVRQAKALAKKKNITIVEACETVGIGYDNYKSVCAAYKRGKTKRT